MSSFPSGGGGVVVDSGTASSSSFFGSFGSSSDILTVGYPTTPITYKITTTVATPINSPQLDFYIPNSEFYINTPGVSAANMAKSATNFKDGMFYLLNKNSIPLYYKDFVLINAQIRSGYLTAVNKIVAVALELTSEDETYTYLVYSLKYRGKLLGYLTIRILSDFYNQPGRSIAPFEIVRFAGSFSAQNVGNLSQIYYGKTITAPDRSIGVIDINFFIECWDSNPNDTSKIPNLLKQQVTVTVNVVNTGYVPTVVNASRVPPPTGGGILPVQQFDSIQSSPSFTL